MHRKKSAPQNSAYQCELFTEFENPKNPEFQPNKITTDRKFKAYFNPRTD